MKKMFNLSVLLYLCSSIINTQCTITDTIGSLASTLNNSPSAIYDSITGMRPGNKALCVLIPLNILALYLAAKVSNYNVNNITLAKAIKRNPAVYYNEIKDFCASQTKLKSVLVDDKLGWVTVHDPVLMYELLAITDKSNNNLVFKDFANKIANMMTSQSYTNNNFIIPSVTTLLAFVSGMIYTEENKYF